MESVYIPELARRFDKNEKNIITVYISISPRRAWMAILESANLGHGNSWDIDGGANPYRWGNLKTVGITWYRITE